MATGIYGNDSSVTFEGIEGTGKAQWVSFYYQSTFPLPYPSILEFANTPTQISMTKASATSVSTPLSHIPSQTNLLYTAGGTPDRIGGAWQLRRISSVVVNGDNSTLQTLYQRDTHKGIILSTPLKLTLAKGKSNTIRVAGLYNGVDYKGADLDRIVVYPAED